MFNLKKLNLHIMTHSDEKLTGIGFIDKLFPDPEVNRYGILAILLTLVGITAGVAVGEGAIHSTIQLAFLAVMTMFAVSMMLAVAPMKWVVISSLGATVINIIIILINIL